MAIARIGSHVETNGEGVGSAAGWVVAELRTVVVVVVLVVGAVVAVVSFVCSIGNVPLAAVLWNGGISFGGVIAFIFADLIVLRILDIYRRYYGSRMAGFLLATFYAAMVAAGLVVELVFGGLGLVPEQRTARVVEASVTWNYTTILNLVFLAVAAVLVVRFLRTGGPAMLKLMSGPAAENGHGQAGDPHHDTH